MNAKDEKGAQTQDVFSMIDTGAKAVAILGGLSVLVGTTFNVSFFLATNSEWLFYLSIADNLTATLYALPVVTATGLILGAGMVALRGADWSVVFGYLVSVVLFAGYLLWRGTGVAPVRPDTRRVENKRRCIPAVSGSPAANADARCCNPPSTERS